MKLRDVRNRKTPPLMIIPMIDIMFFPAGLFYAEHDVYD